MLFLIDSINVQTCRNLFFVWIVARFLFLLLESIIFADETRCFSDETRCFQMKLDVFR